METGELERQKREELDALESARVSLGRPDEKKHTNLTDHLRSLDMVFPTTNHHNRSSTKYLQMSLTLLEKQDNYRAWFESNHSFLLLLGGNTKPEGQMQQSGYSWLSPAATDTALKLQESGDVTVAFFSYPKSWVHADDEPTMCELVAGLLFQVLSSDTAILKDNFQRQLSSLKIDAWVGKNDKETLNLIMESVASLFRKAGARRWVYLIVDRAERCKSGLEHLLGWFHRLVTDSECKIKVLIVFDSIRSGMSEQDWQEFDQKGHVYSKIGWNQEKMGFEKFPLREPSFTESPKS